MAVNKTIEVDLGKQQADVERRVESGEYEDASDVIRDALHALDRDDIAHEELLRVRVRESMANREPSLLIDEVFKRVRAQIALTAKATERDA